MVFGDGHKKPSLKLTALEGGSHDRSRGGLWSEGPTPLKGRAPDCDRMRLLNPRVDSEVNRRGLTRAHTLLAPVCGQLNPPCSAETAIG
jgi:hypothetical protein